MAEVTEFFSKLYQLIQHQELWGPLAVVVPTIGLAAFWAGRYFPKKSFSIVFNNAKADKDGICLNDPRVPRFEEEIGELQRKLTSATIHLENARRAVSANGPGLWLAIPPVAPSSYRHRLKSSIPIYTLANLKGGVGKTTIAIGLAAHFANPFGVPRRKSERVLLVDLDFQGSLSSMALTISDRIPEEGGTSRATKLISGSATPTDLMHMRQRVKGLDKLHYGSDTKLYAIPAYYDLAQAENRLMVEWLIGDGTADIRYHLADILLSDEVQTRFDRIIIDAPPRLSTAHVQALSTSTHVLIPTVLDQLSGEAVGSFVEQLLIHAELWPHLKIAGVIGSMTEWGQDKALRPYELEGVLAIGKALEQKKDQYGLKALPCSLLPRGCFIPDLAELGRAAGSRIGYLDPDSKSDKIRQAFDGLAGQVADAAAKATELKELLRP